MRVTAWLSPLFYRDSVSVRFELTDFCHFVEQTCKSLLAVKFVDNEELIVARSQHAWEKPYLLVAIKILH
jgi:hypothetical protein